MSSPTLSGASATTRLTPTDGGRIMADTGIVERVDGLQGTVFVWKVKDFSKIRDEVKAEFNLCGHPCLLKLKTAGDRIVLLLSSFDPFTAVDIQFSLGFRSGSGKTEMGFGGSCSSYGGKDMFLVYGKMFMKSELFRRREELFPLDVLAIAASLKIKSPAEGRSHSKQREVSFPTLSGASATTRPAPTDGGRIMADTGIVERVDSLQGTVFVWKVKDFSKIPDEVKAEFNLCGRTFLLRLKTEGDYIYLDLMSHDSAGPAVDIQFSLGFRSTSGKTEMEFGGSCSFNGGKDMILLSGKRFQKSELFRRREELLPLDVLTIAASLKIKSPAEGRSHSKQREVFFPTLSGASATTRPTPTDGGRIMTDTGTVERVDGLQGPVFVWKVKDFSKIQGFVKAEFNLCGHTWFLILGTEGDFIPLALVFHDSGPAVGIQFSLGFRSGSGKTEMEFGGSCSFYGSKDMLLVSGKRFMKSELFRRREELLPLDVLAIAASLKIKSPSEGRSHCKQREVSFPTLSGASATTRPAPTDGGHIMADTGTVERVDGLQGSVFVWKVKDFSKIPDEVEANFNLCGHNYRLTLKTADDYIALFLYSFGPGPAVDIQFSLGFRSASGKSEMEFGGSCSSYGVKDTCPLSGRIFKKSELFRRREELLPLDVLTIVASLKRKSPSEGTRDVSVQTGADCIAAENGQYEKEGKTDTKDVSVQTRVEDIAPEDGKDVRSEKAGTERVLQDIGNMWPNDEHCDVVFRVRDVEFKAHRLILSARTPVLGAMFSHDTVEKASGVVTIEDCEPAVFEQLLHYVYKGAPRELTPENAYPLFTVADKYLVSEVKTLCVRFMRDTLCVDTFCSTVTLALMHKEDELLEIAVDFFSRNMLDIVQTVQWQTFNRDHSTWANEILICSLKIRQEKKT